jgi:hypothetical protein
MIATPGEQNMAEQPSTNAPAELVRAILFREGDHWIGQCIEYDICAQAKNLTELKKKLELTIEFEREVSVKRHGYAFAGIPAAPQRFEEMWNKGWAITPSTSAEFPREIQNDEKIVDLELALCA